MEFKEQYLTYEEYKALGGDLDLLPFNLLEFEIRRKIDIRTQNRLQGVDKLPQEVKLCAYKMIDTISNYAKTMAETSGNMVASESIDGYSVNYLTGGEITNIISSKNAELEDIMENYLMNVVVNGKHIMFLGVD